MSSAWPIDLDLLAGRNGIDDAQAARGGAVGQGLARSVQQAGKLDGLDVGESAGAVRKGRLCGGADLVDRSDDAIESGLLRARQGGLEAQQFGVGADRRQWRADLVVEVGGELALAGQHVVDAISEAPEGFHQHTGFVAAVADRKRRTWRRAGDAAGSCDDRLDSERCHCAGNKHRGRQQASQSEKSAIPKRYTRASAAVASSSTVRRPSSVSVTATWSVLPAVVKS